MGLSLSFTVPQTSYRVLGFTRQTSASIFMCLDQSGEWPSCRKGMTPAAGGCWKNLFKISFEFSHKHLGHTGCMGRMGLERADALKLIGIPARSLTKSATTRQMTAEIRKEVWMGIYIYMIHVTAWSNAFVLSPQKKFVQGSTNNVTSSILVGPMYGNIYHYYPLFTYIATTNIQM